MLRRKQTREKQNSGCNIFLKKREELGEYHFLVQELRNEDRDFLLLHSKHFSLHLSPYSLNLSYKTGYSFTFSDISFSCNVNDAIFF